MKTPLRFSLAGINPFGSLLDVAWLGVPMGILLVFKIGMLASGLSRGPLQAIVVGGTVGILMSAFKMIPFYAVAGSEQERGALKAVRDIGFVKIDEEGSRRIYRSNRPMWPRWDHRWDSDRIVIDRLVDGTFRITCPLIRVRRLKKAFRAYVTT